MRIRIRTRILCLLAALLAAAPLLWAGPAHAAGTAIHAHGDNRGPGGGGDDDADEDDDDDDRRGATVTTAAPAAGPAAVPAAPGPAAVAIVDGGFQPAAVSVAAGSQVTWTNTDGSRHTATAQNGAFDSGTLNRGATFSFAFSSPGTFAYFCAFHSDMQGTVTVAGPALAAQGSPAVPARAAAPSTTSTPTTTAVAAAPRGTASVEARDYEFTPARLTVGRGAEVTWRNTGEAPHTVTGDGFDGGELTSGQTFARRFDTPGTYAYRCELHPRMQGVVEVVTDPTAVPAGADLGGFPIERVAAAGIVGAPLLLLVGAVFFWGRR